MEKKTLTKKSSFPVKVTRTWLLNFAASIYDPKTRKFLRLCDGKLQNGPDPENEERPMHCGLGELYFATTGRQPDEDGVDEEEVVNRTLELSTIYGTADHIIREAQEQARKFVASLKLPKSMDSSDRDDILQSLNSDLDNQVNGSYGVEDQFTDILNEIPKVNDDGCGTLYCTLAQYRDRSKRVAKLLRDAARLLPE